MTKTKKMFLKALGGLVVAYFALAVFASEGVVVDDNGKPVKGAVVMAYWQINAGLFVQPQTTCYHIEAKITDEHGKFTIPLLAGFNPFGGRRSMEVVFPGHVESPKSNSEKLYFVVTPLTGTRSEQFKTANQIFRDDCGNEKAALPMFKIRYADLIRLAETKEEKEICESLLFSIESREFGQKIAEDRSTQRRMAYVEKLLAMEKAKEKAK